MSKKKKNKTREEGRKVMGELRTLIVNACSELISDLYEVVTETEISTIRMDAWHLKMFMDIEDWMIPKAIAILQEMLAKDGEYVKRVMTPTLHGPELEEAFEFGGRIKQHWENGDLKFIFMFKPDTRLKITT